MTAYRNEVEALRRRLEIEKKRADDAEAKLDSISRGRENRWDGDIQLFLTRLTLIGVPLAFVTLLTMYFFVGAVFGVFDDSRPLAFLFTFAILPFLAVSPIAAWKLEKPSRAGWGLALFSFLCMIFLAPPAGLWGLASILRGRVRDAVFGMKEEEARLRVEVPAELVEPASESAEEEEELEVPAEPELSRTSRSVG